MGGGPKNGSGKHDLVIDSETWWKKVTGTASVPPSPPPPKLPSQLGWLKWLVTVVAAIFVGGFVAAQWVQGFARTDDVRGEASRYRSDHAADHVDLDAQMRVLEDRSVQIRIEQVRQSERQRLLDVRIELLLERSDRGRRSPVAERALVEQIREQELRVEAVDSDPQALMRDFDPP
jgi:hypothetical protein